jgi:hypothetical protein
MEATTNAPKSTFPSNASEPISGVTGDVSKGEPYDAGNMDAPKSTFPGNASEPVSGVTGNVSKGEPYDAGNMGELTPYFPPHHHYSPSLPFCLAQLHRVPEPKPSGFNSSNDTYTLSTHATFYLPASNISIHHHQLQPHTTDMEVSLAHH